jgi:hypothetical protein
MRIVDAAKRELKVSDIAVETLPVTSSNRIPLMMNGTVDLVCSSTTNNAERQRQVAFTNSHFLSATRFAARKSDNITTIDQLKGKPVVAISGSTNMVQLNQVNTARNLGITALAAKDQAEAFLMLETGRAAAYVLDDVQLAVAIARSKDPSAYMISAETLSKAEPYGIMLRKDDAPSRPWPIGRLRIYMEARRLKRFTGSGSNRRCRPTASISRLRCQRFCARHLHIRQIARTRQATSAEGPRSALVAGHPGLMPPAEGRRSLRLPWRRSSSGPGPGN